MPRVPILESPRVASRPLPTPYAHTDFDIGGAAVARGVQQLGAGLAGLAEGAAAYVESTRQLADAIAVSDALNEFQRRGRRRIYGDIREQSIEVAHGGVVDKEFERALFGERPKPFKEYLGVEAMKESAGYLEALERDREEIARGLANEEQRELFRRHSQRAFESLSLDIERHASKQFEEAKVASLKGAQQLALDEVATHYADEERAAAVAEEVEQRLRAFALSDEDAEARATAWRAEVAKARLNQYLAMGDWRGAQSLFSRSREALGHEAATFQARIDAEKVGAEAERIATEAVASATDATGRVNPLAVLKAIDRAIPEGDNRLRRAARMAAGERASVLESAWKRETEDLMRRARAEAAKGLSALRKLESEMRARSEETSKYYDVLVSEVEHRLRLRRGDANARRVQAAANGRALHEFQGLPPEERAAMTDDELEAFGRMWGADDVGISALKPWRQKAAESVQRGFAREENEFVTSVRAAATAMGEKLKGAGKPAQRLEDITAAARLRFQRFVEAEKRAPTADEVASMAAELTTESATAPRTFLPEAIFGKAKETGYERVLREYREHQEREKKSREEAFRALEESPPVTVEKIRETRAQLPRARTVRDEQALQWARAHPEDPRAKEILRRLGETQ